MNPNNTPDANRASERTLTRRRLGPLLAGGAVLSAAGLVRGTTSLSAKHSSQTTGPNRTSGATDEKAGPSAASAPSSKAKVCSNKQPSQAVVQGALAASLRYYGNIRDGKLTSADVRNMATATGILFAHMDELGFTDAVDELVKSGPIPIRLEVIKMARKQRRVLGRKLPGIPFPDIDALATASPGSMMDMPSTSVRVLQSHVLSYLDAVAKTIDSHGMSVTRTLFSANNNGVRITPVGTGACAVAVGICVAGAAAFLNGGAQTAAQFCLSNLLAFCFCGTIFLSWAGICYFATQHCP